MAEYAPLNEFGGPPNQGPDAVESATNALSCPRITRLFMMFLGILATALLFALIFFQEGRLNTWTNAKSMHYTRNKNIYTWMSIFPSQVYSNQVPRALQQYYKVVDGVMDQQPTLTEQHGFQIAGGFGILTNISSNVYLSALVVIYMLSAFDSALLGFDSTDDMKLKKPVYFTWITMVVGVFYISAHMFQKFGTWHDVQWGSGPHKVSVKYSWEAGASLLYASVVVMLYIVHVNVKNGVWHALIPSAADRELDYTLNKRKRKFFIQIGTESEGPASKEASVLFAATLFLLVMGILGDSRSVVLETDVQLVLVCTISLSLLTLLCMRVRVYFEWVKEHYMPKDQEHATMMDFILQLVDLIAIAVSGVLLGVAIHVLATMFEAENNNLLYISFVIFTSFYLFIRVLQLLGTLLNARVTEMFKTQLDNWWDHVYFVQHVLATMFIICLLWAFVFTVNHGHDKLRRLESIQYLGMHKTDVATNSNCATGVKYNTLLHDFMELKAETKYADISASTDNPVNFKVFAWTRWWQLELRQTGAKQGPAQYFCSNGLEQEYGVCAAEVSLRPGVKFEDNFQYFVDQSLPNNLVSA